MAIHLNKAILVGRLGANPEIKGRESMFVTMRVATSESWRDKDTGERQERTQWHTVVIFNEHTAKFVTQYAKKGDLVCVEGTIETRKWEAPDGDKYFTEIVVRQYGGSVQVLSKEGREAAEPEEKTPGEKQEHRSAQIKAPAKGGGSWKKDLDDEIPFAPEWR